MNSQQLDNIKTRSAEILIDFTNGHLDERLKGGKNITSSFNDCMRAHYLHGIIDAAHLAGSDVYVGSELLSEADFAQAYHKLYHYNGIYTDVDLSNYLDITPDDGDGDSETETPETSTQDHYRSGAVAVGAGSATVTFSSPLPSTDYQVDAYVRSASGYEQDNLGTVTKSLNGFTVSDILEAGTLIYFAVIDQ